MSKNKVILIDGNSIFYRAFYALPALQNENGEYSNAIYGFSNILIKLITEFKPTHIVVAFDAAKHTFRNDLYVDYKANRKPMPDEMRVQAEPIRQMLKLMKIKVVEKIGVEADDILGTLAHKFADDTLIVTGDRDCFQLIDDNTFVCFTKKGVTDVQIIDNAEFEKMYGFEPIHIIDLKSLQGDTADNIPGVKGVGEKTALALVQKYKTLESVYEHIGEITGKAKTNLENGKENGFLSKTLATINDKVDVDCELEDCKFEFPFSQDVFNFMQGYGFKSIIKRKELFAEVKNTYIEKYAKVHIENVNLIEKMSNLINCLQKCDEFGIVVFQDEAHVFACGIEFLINLKPNLLGEGIAFETFIENLKPFFESKRVVVFDYKNLLHMVCGLDVKFGDVFDVSIAKHLVDGVSVKDLASVLDSEGADESICGSVLVNLKNEYQEKLENLGMHKLFYDVEMPLVLVLFDMEKTGFTIDENRLLELKKQYETEIENLKKEIYSLCGEQFNIDSPKQMAHILFEKLELSHNKKMSTDIDQLLMIENEHPVVPLIIRYRKLAKLNGTYIKGMQDRIASDGKIHTNFKQTLTSTGRLSSTDPNLQNLPIRTEESREIRSMFTASNENNVLIDVDYSQIELRLLAHFSGDDIFVDAFKNGEDVHTGTACGIFGVDESQVTKDMRRAAKVVNFGIIYGISDFGLAKDLGIATYEAKRYIKSYYEKHPKVDAFMKDAVRVAHETGRVGSILNRSRRMVDITATNALVRQRAERASQNMRLQGSAADIIKLAMVGVFNKLKNYKAKLIMQVHDELVVDCPKEEQRIVEEIVKTEMENAIKLNVPLTVDSCASFRWSEGH